jgi:hypothetical protein
MKFSFWQEREAAGVVGNAGRGVFEMRQARPAVPSARASLFVREADGVAGEVPASEDAPYCTRCEWDQTIVNIGGPEIRRYFRTADAAFFDRRSLRVLSDW